MENIWSTSDDVLHKIAMGEAGEVHHGTAVEIAKVRNGMSDKLGICPDLKA
jgi:hypothetical protein